MTDEWFDGFVYEAEVSMDHLPDSVRSMLETSKEVTLQPWDPYGRIN